MDLTRSTYLPSDVADYVGRSGLPIYVYRMTTCTSKYLLRHNLCHLQIFHHSHPFFYGDHRYYPQVLSAYLLVCLSAYKARQNKAKQSNIN